MPRIECKTNHGDYAEYCVEYCNQCDASDKVDCDAGLAGPVDCVEVGGAKCY